MMQVLEFIFQDFWHWLGSFLIICAICSIPSGLIKIHINKKETQAKKEP